MLQRVYSKHSGVRQFIIAGTNHSSVVKFLDGSERAGFDARHSSIPSLAVAGLHSPPRADYYSSSNISQTVVFDYCTGELVRSFSSSRILDAKDGLLMLFDSHAEAVLALNYNSEYVMMLMLLMLQLVVWC